MIYLNTKSIVSWLKLCFPLLRRNSIGVTDGKLGAKRCKKQYIESFLNDFIYGILV